MCVSVSESAVKPLTPEFLPGRMPMTPRIGPADLEGSSRQECDRVDITARPIMGYGRGPESPAASSEHQRFSFISSTRRSSLVVITLELA